MIALRFGPATCLTLALALVPVARHEYMGTRADDARQTRAIPDRLAGLAGEAVTTRPWIGGAFASTDWIDRRYSGLGSEIDLFAARSYDFKRLYHHPELTLLRGVDLDARPSVVLPGNPWAYYVLAPPDESGRSGLAVYVLLYGGQPVNDPYAFQLRAMWELLFRPPQPMTLVMGYDAGVPAGAPLGETTLVRLMADAVRGFLQEGTAGAR